MAKRDSGNGASTSRIFRWLGLQVASKAVGLALGAPVVTGAVMGGLAYVQGLPVAWGFFAVVGVAAFTSMLLNQARSFLVSYSAAGKIVFEPGEVIWAKSKAGVDGYGVAMKVVNKADIPLEYEVRRAVAHIDGVITKGDDPNALKGGVLVAGGQMLHAFGVAKMEARRLEQFQGELEFLAAYGRPGRLNHLIEFKFSLMINTDENGRTTDVRFAHQRL